MLTASAVCATWSLSLTPRRSLGVCIQIGLLSWNISVAQYIQSSIGELSEPISIVVILPTAYGCISGNSEAAGTDEAAVSTT